MDSSPKDTHEPWRLPPLILHPFSDGVGPEKLAESSRASLMLQGILPSGEFALETLTRMVVEGRLYELRMLFYIGKDLERWIEQCMDFVSRDETLSQNGLKASSFAAFLIDDPPQAVREKVQSWGVLDYKTIFSRALGLNAVFTSLPGREAFSEPFIRHYHHYVDEFYECRQGIASFPRIDKATFHFEIYASGEYARLLERHWEES